MTKETLEKLAAERSESTCEIFTPNDFYGHAYLIKKYCGIKQGSPLPGIYPHAISFRDKVWDVELKHPIPFLLLKSKLQSDVYSKYSDKPSWIIGAPNYYALRLVQNELKEAQFDAKGSIVFPIHSTHYLINNYNFSEFTDYLKKLPEKYLPVTICLGWRDIQLKMHEHYMQQGFECTTAGHMYDKEFFIRLIKIIASHKFAITNHLGTSAFYCAAMNLPVILYRQSIKTNPAKSDQPAYLLQEAQPKPYLPAVETFIDISKDPDANMVKQQKDIAKLILGYDYIKEPHELHDLFESLWQRNEMRPFVKKPNYLFEGSFSEIIEATGKEVRSYPRRTPGRLKIDGISLAFADLHSFYHQAIQIFNQNLYGFKSTKDNPVIIDCGAHIGLASIYFSKKYPRGEIYAYEADAAIAKMLAENIKSFGLKNVTVFEKAVWIDNDGVLFESTNDDSGYISNIENVDCRRIPSIRLKSIIANKEIDLLKLDIEGAEYEVIADCDSVLKNVKKIIIEVHKFRDLNGSLGDILGILEKNNFEYTFGDLHSANWIETPVKPPFDAVNTDKFIITIFAWQNCQKHLAHHKKFKPTVNRQTELLEQCVEYLNQHDNDRAIKYIEQAMTEYPEIPALNYGKALALARAGQNQVAIDTLRSLLENIPNHQKAQELFEALKQDNENGKNSRPERIVNESIV